MSLYTAAVLLCVLSLTAAARDAAGVRDDLTTALSTRSLLAKYSRNNKPSSSTVLSIDLTVNEGTSNVAASASHGGGSPTGSARHPTRRSRGRPTSSLFKSTSTTTSSYSSPSKSGSHFTPLRPRSRGGLFISGFAPVPSIKEPAPGPASPSGYFGFDSGPGDVDLNKVTTVTTRSFGIQEELPRGEKNLNHNGYKSASKRPYQGSARKGVSKASASTSYGGVGVVEVSSSVRVGRKPRKSTKAAPSSRRPKRSPKKRSRGIRGY